MDKHVSLSELEFSYNSNKDYLRIEYYVDMNIQGEEFYKTIKQQILDNEVIVEKFKKEYQSFKDGFSNLEGYCEGYSQLRNQIDEIFKSILTKNDRSNEG